MLYHCRDPKKPKFLLLEPTGISAVNIGRSTFNSGLGIKSGTKVLGLNDKFKVALKWVVRGEIINNGELSMVSSDLWTDDSVLEEIFMMISEKAFASLSVLTLSDLFQLPPVREKLYFLNFLIRIV